MTPDDYKAIREALVRSVNSALSRGMAAATAVETKHWRECAEQANRAIKKLEKYKPESEE